jgi:F420-dependent oxidoreductase-like protein
MRIGVFLGEPAGPDPVLDLAEKLRAAAEAGFASAWIPHIFGVDALTAIAAAGREAPGIEIGTSVIPTYPRHPMALAQQALTTQSAIGGRLALGIGLSHQLVIEGMFHLSFDRPARHMREYLDVLLPLVRENKVDAKGETLGASGALNVPGASPFPVLLAALAPRMLRLAGGVADGTVTWMTGPRTIAEHIVPSIRAAADDAGRADPRVVCALPVCVSDDPDAARERAAKVFAVYGQLPSYRAMLDREGAEGPADVAVVGDEASVRDQIEAIAAHGATDFVAAGDEHARSELQSALDGLA